MMAEEDEEDQRKESDLEVLRKALSDDWPPPPSFGPKARLVDRFSDLDPRLRLLLQRLSHRDMDTIVYLIEQHQRASTVWRIVKKLAIWMVGTFSATALFGDQVLRVLDKFRISLW